MNPDRAVGISGFTNFVTEVPITEQNIDSTTFQATPYHALLADKIDHYIRYLDEQINKHLNSSGKENKHIPGNKSLQNQLIQETTELFQILNTEINNEEFPDHTDKGTMINDINSLIEATGKDTDADNFRSESDTLLDDLRELQMNV